MSHYMTALAMKQTGLKPAEKIVLYWLADHHNSETGLCCPSLNSLAKECEMGKTTLVRQLDRLEAAGLIERQRRTRDNGSQASTVYILRLTPVSNRNSPCSKSEQAPVSNRNSHTNLGNNNLGNEPPLTPQGGQDDAREAEKENAIEAEFSTWWEQYPRKVGKLAAKKAYAKAVKSASAEDLLGGLKAQLPHLRDQAARGFCPHPSTWLNAGRWEDAVDTSAPPPKRTGELSNDEYLRSMGIL